MRASVCWVMLLVGCASDSSVAATEPALVASNAAELRVIAQRDGRQLLAGPPSVTAPQSDERPTYAMAVRERGRPVHAPTRMLGGALVAGGVVWVTPASALVDSRGSTLERDVIPEIAVNAEGTSIAYPRRAEDGQGVYVRALDAGSSRLVSPGLATADRPLFLPDGRLVVVGSRPSGIAGVWLIDLPSGTPPVPVTNATLRTGVPFGPTFVPPPAHYASMRLDGDVLVYDDGRREQRVPLQVSR